MEIETLHRDDLLFKPKDPDFPAHFAWPLENIFQYKVSEIKARQFFTFYIQEEFKRLYEITKDEEVKQLEKQFFSKKRNILIKTENPNIIKHLQIFQDITEDYKTGNQVAYFDEFTTINVEKYKDLIFKKYLILTLTSKEQSLLKITLILMILKNLINKTNYKNELFKLLKLELNNPLFEFEHEKFISYHNKALRSSNLIFKALFLKNYLNKYLDRHYLFLYNDLFDVAFNTIQDTKIRNDLLNILKETINEIKKDVL